LAPRSLESQRRGEYYDHEEVISPVEDLMMIAIDFEGIRDILKCSSTIECISNGSSQVGLAQLKIQDLFKCHCNSSLSNIIAETIENRTITIGSRQRGQARFGTTVKATYLEAQTILKRFLPRRALLVGHNPYGADIGALAALGLDPDQFIGVLDTAQLAQDIWGVGHYSLKSVLRRLGYSYRGFHNAGNDAHFTLIAVLLFAVAAFQDKQLVEEERFTCQRIQDIARATLTITDQI